MILDGQTLTRWEITVESNRGKKMIVCFQAPTMAEKYERGHVFMWAREGEYSTLIYCHCQDLL